VQERHEQEGYDRGGRVDDELPRVDIADNDERGSPDQDEQNAEAEEVS
jgi:hypothetical protein